MYFIYGRNNCPHCDTALQAANRNDLEVSYINLSENPVMRMLFKQAGYKTVPQVFRVEGGEPAHIGGCSEFLEHLAA